MVRVPFGAIPVSREHDLHHPKNHGRQITEGRAEKIRAEAIQDQRVGPKKAAGDRRETDRQRAGQKEVIGAAGILRPCARSTDGR